MEITSTRKVTTFEMEGGTGGGSMSMTRSSMSSSGGGGGGSMSMTRSSTSSSSGGGGEVSMSIIREGKTGGAGGSIEISQVWSCHKIACLLRFVVKESF